MAIDTKNKRLSVLEWDEYWGGGLPDPDDSVDQADRQHFLYSPTTILFAAPAAVDVIGDGTIISVDAARVTEAVNAPVRVTAVNAPVTVESI